MNKAQFIDKLAKKTCFTKTDVEHVIDSAFEIIQKSVAQGKEIKFVGFGTFDKSTRQKRNGTNPKTREQIVIPKTHVPRFRPGKNFKEQVNHL